MTNKVLVIFPEEKVSQEGLENYTSRITQLLQVQMSLDVKPFFHRHGCDSGKDLKKKLDMKPKVVAFDECHHATIKKIHNEVKRVNPSVIFLAKNYNVNDHGISGINTIDSLGKISLFLTSLNIN